MTEQLVSPAPSTAPVPAQPRAWLPRPELPPPLSRPRSMLRTLRIYRRGLAANLRSVLEYEADFWILVVAGLLHQILNLIFLSAVFAQVPTLNGWTYPECVLLAGLLGIAGGMGPLFFEGIWRTATRINHGELDYPLVRPAPVPAQLISSGIGLHGLGDILVAGAMLVWALGRVDVAWSPLTVLGGLGLFVSAIAIQLAIITITNVASFWTPGPHPFFAVAVQHIGSVVKYPISIFGLTFRVALSTLLPFAFINFFPASWLLGKETGWLGLLTPVVALTLIYLARITFRAGLRRYDSSGH